MNGRRAVVLALAALVLGVSSGCARGAARSPAESVARRFVDAHYVDIDKPTALTYTIGPARAQVEREIAETKGHDIATDTRKPEVRYELEQSKQAGADSVTFLFGATIAVPGGGKLAKELWVTTQSTPEGWKVLSFSDREPIAAHTSGSGGGA